MTKFVKLESGKYINVDSIITIGEKVGETYCAYTLGFDSQWAAHSEDLTESDLSNVLKVNKENSNTDDDLISSVKEFIEDAKKDLEELDIRLLKHHLEVLKETIDDIEADRKEG